MDRKRILVVDDEPEMVEVIKTRLSAEDYDVVVAVDGQEALNKTKDERPDLIILDLMLPKMDGYKVCGLLKKDSRYKAIPIIMFTVRAKDSDREMGIELGDRVLIIGDGPIGLTFLQLVKRMGAGFVATSGRRPRRRELARELGADEALDADAVDLKEMFGQSLDRVIVATSNIEVAAKALSIVRSGGSLLLFSGYTYGTILPVDVNDVHYRELHIHGSIDCTVQDFRRAAKLLS